jgi:hypothetical protein
LNKPSIGIYGDSYANLNLEQGNAGSWLEILEKEFEIHNYGYPGNSVYKCYDDCMKNFNKHDHNIFIITTSSRFYSNYLENFNLGEFSSNFKNWYNIYGSISIIENKLKRYGKPGENSHILDIVNSVKLYHEVWQDMEMFEDIKNALVDQLEAKVNNILFINTMSKNDNIGICDISCWELEQVGFDPKSLNVINKDNNTFCRDIRKNHLSLENNIILGNKIYKALKENTKELKVSYDDFVKPVNDISHYIDWEPI